MTGRSRTRDVVPAAPLYRFVPAARPRENDPGSPYGRRDWTRDVAARLGVSERTVTRWVTRMREGGVLDYYTADELCAAVGVPFRYVYPEAS